MLACHVRHAHRTLLILGREAEHLGGGVKLELRDRGSPIEELSLGPGPTRKVISFFGHGPTGDTGRALPGMNGRAGVQSIESASTSMAT